MSVPVLVAFAGPRGVGRTTLARLVARALPATYLRIDAIATAPEDLSARNLADPRNG